MQLVGPLNAVPAKALPEDLYSFLATPVGSASPAKAGQTPGAVYVSMGTVVRLTEAEVIGMAANLAALERPVIWKLDAAELPGMHLRYAALLLNERTVPGSIDVCCWSTCETSWLAQYAD